MADRTAPDVLARLATLEATVRQQGAELTWHRRRGRYGRSARRTLPLLLAALLVALVPLATLAANPFTDLTGGPHDGNIDAIYNAGITKGCVPDAEYCPTGNVTREEMASFLARTAGLGGNPPVANALTAQTATNATSATTAQSAGTAQTATNAAQLGGVPAANYIQATSRLLPIAFATVGPSGAKFSGTDNVTVTKFATGTYHVTISGESYSYPAYTTIATIVGGGAQYQIASGAGPDNKLAIVTANSSGVPADWYFNFVVYKP